MNYLTADFGTTFFGGRGGSGGSAGALSSLEGVGYLVTLFVKFSFTIAGIAILYFFVLAGFGMIQGAGKNDPKQMEQAKATATSALIGFIVVLTSYWIVKLIEQLLNIKLL